jgi:hypothetical protein
MVRRSAVLLALISCLGVAGLAGCGSKSSANTSASTPPVSSSSSASGAGASTTHFAKTKFVFHAGLALGAFHRYIYAPFKAGVLGKPASHKLALVKAALAGLFAYHELKLAASDVRSSKILRTLFAPITLLAAKMKAIRAQFLGGNYSAADISAAEAAAGGISSASTTAGYPITESTPTTRQLAAGVVQ